MELEIVRADPAGNITIFVMNPPPDKDAQAQAARILMADPELKAEQVGFVTPPAGSGLWRLRMSADEFCGNASRSFGLLAAGLSGLSGKVSLTVEVSGAGRLEVHVDTGSGDAEIDIPGPLAEESVEFRGRHFPLYVFGGISHLIAEDMSPDTSLVLDLVRHIEQLTDNSRGPYAGNLNAFGVMFYDTRGRFMRPVVWVRDTGKAAPESSCGSGSAALAVWAARNLPDADQELDIAQPGGMIRTRVLKKQGKMLKLSIGGQVKLSAAFRYTVGNL
jgi:diaminopimelate epimerase